MSISLPPERLLVILSYPNLLEGAMKYLCLIYENEKAWETMPPAESEAIMNECERLERSAALPERCDPAAASRLLQTLSSSWKQRCP